MIKLFSLLILFSSSRAFGGWGLNDDSVVKDCAKIAKGAREEFRGKVSQSDGSIVIRNLDKKKTVIWFMATQETNEVIQEKMDFRHTLYATFLAYPTEKETPGQLRLYCVQRLRNIRWQQIPAKKT